MEVFTPNEVQKHKHPNDLWVIHHGKVYDVTDFVSVHPGGPDIMLENAGLDISESMANVGHSKAAYEILAKYRIGKLVKQNVANGISNGVKSRGKIKDISNNNSTSLLGNEGPNFEENYTEDDLVDWSKPIFWQVGSLGEEYIHWVHRPVNKKLRLFYSDFVEFFSHTVWWVIPALWIPVMFGLLWFSYTSLREIPEKMWGFYWSPQLMPVLFFFGFLLWTLLEYVVHRWLFHLTPPADSKFWITTHFILHGQHHKAPFDRYRLVFPPVPATGFAIFFYLCYRLCFPYGITLCLLAGTMLGYISYDMTHYYLHHGNSSLSYFQRLKRYHNRHHFEDVLKGFGISSKFWDYPFGTLIPDQKQ